MVPTIIYLWVGIDCAVGSSMKNAVIKKQIEQADKVITITRANLKLPGETFEAYMKRMAAQRQGAK